MYIYYPSCNFATMHLQTAKKVRDYFEKQIVVKLIKENLKKVILVYMYVKLVESK